MSTHKFFLYTRKSTDTEDRQVYSIEHQLTELRQLAARKNLEVVAEFTENRTASSPGRPVFNDMIARIKKGEASGILAWHPDRLARNPIDGGQIMHLIDQGDITHLEFSVFWFEPTPQGNLMLAIAFGMSKYYTDALSQNIKRGLRQRVNDGYFPARPPVGYLFDRNQHMVVPDPQQVPHIRKTFELYATGEYTLERLSQTMTAQGLRTRPKRDAPLQPVSFSRLYEMLHNPFYLGMFRFNGELHEGKHEPLISQTLFNRCQAVLLQRGKTPAPGLKPFLYRGMFKCGECGGTITIEVKKGHSYMRCTKRNGPCRQRYLREEDMIAKVAKVLQHFVVPQELIDDMLVDLKQKRAEEKDAWSIEAKSIKAKIAAFDAKLQRLTDLYIDGSLPAADYNKTKETLLLQKRSWTEKLTYVETTRQSSIEPTIRFIRGLTEARIVAQGNDALQKRDLLQKACSNLRLRGGRVLWEARGAWKHVVPLGRFANDPSDALNTPDTSDPRFSARWSLSRRDRRVPAGFQVFFNENAAWA
jgi:site-specific DNA recombinase